MNHFDLYAVVGEVPFRFAPAWQSERREATSGVSGLCPCLLLDGRGKDSVTARWHRVGDNTTAPHPPALGISAGLARLAWAGSMALKLAELGRLPAPVDGMDYLSTLADAAVDAGPGDLPAHDPRTLPHKRTPRANGRALEAACREAASLIAKLKASTGGGISPKATAP